MSDRKPRDPALPCPFCGSTMPPTTTLTDGYKWGALQCPECSASGPEVRTGYGEPKTWYDDALAEWNRRFQATWHELEPMGFDRRFKRMWEFYLAYCEAGFRSGSTDVTQVALVRP